MALVALLLLAAIAGVAAGGEVDAGRAPRRRARAAGSPARRACPTPAATTRWCPPTAGRWRDWCGPWRRPRPRAAAPTACRSSRSTSAAAASESCAVAAGPHLSASGRRTTAFTEIEDRRRTARLGRGRLLALPADDRLGPSGSPREPGRRRGRLRHPGPAQGRSGARPAGDPARAATTTTSRRARNRPGSGGSGASTRAGRARCGAARLRHTWPVSSDPRRPRGSARHSVATGCGGGELDDGDRIAR